MIFIRCCSLLSGWIIARKQHSWKVTKDILMNMNSQQTVLVVLLDLNAAFDTVDHTILLRRLQFSFGITGTPLEWFTWYLTTSCLYLQNSLWYFSSWLRCSIRVLSWSSIVHHLFLQILWYTWTAPPKCLLLCWRLSAVSCLNVSLMNRKVGMMP